MDDKSTELEKLQDAWTHLGCAVAWDEKQRRFSCHCHGSTFSLVGGVLNGRREFFSE